MHESVHVLPPATAITLKQGPTSTSSSLITKAMESKAHQRYSVVVCHIVSTNFNLTGSPTVSRTHWRLILEPNHCSCRTLVQNKRVGTWLVVTAVLSAPASTGASHVMHVNLSGSHGQPALFSASTMNLTIPSESDQVTTKQPEARLTFAKRTTYVHFALCLVESTCQKMPTRKI